MENNRKSVEHNWKNRGFSCDVWTDPPGTVWIDFVHKTDELLMLIEGKIELEMSGQIFHPVIGEECRFGYKPLVLWIQTSLT